MEVQQRKNSIMIKHLYFESKHLPDLSRCLNRKYHNGSKVKFNFTIKSLIPELYSEMITALLPELDELLFGSSNKQCREYLWTLHRHGRKFVKADISVYSCIIPEDRIQEINFIVTETVKIQNIITGFELNTPTLPKRKLIDCGFAVCNEINYIQ